MIVVAEGRVPAGPAASTHIVSPGSGSRSRGKKSQPTPYSLVSLAFLQHSACYPDRSEHRSVGVSGHTERRAWCEESAALTRTAYRRPGRIVDPPTWLASHF